MFKIEKRIPMSFGKPKKKSNYIKPIKYPWAAMGVGDSFFVKGYTNSYKRGVLTGDPVLNPHILGPRFIENSKWSSRSVVERGEYGVRCWRVS